MGGTKQDTLKVLILDLDRALWLIDGWKRGRAYWSDKLNNKLFGVFYVFWSILIGDELDDETLVGNRCLRRVRVTIGNESSHII